MSNKKVIGTCGNCGGTVTVPATYLSVVPPTQCEKCGAVPRCEPRTEDRDGAAEAHRVPAGALQVKDLEELLRERARHAELPSLAECISAGTHMIRCTGDGACKVCFRDDIAGAELFTARLGG